MSGLCKIAVANGSIARANNRGERGQPCLVPFPILKKFELQPGNLILVAGLL